MKVKTIRAVGAGLLAAVWIGLTGWAWFGPAKDISETERRPLEQMPPLTVKTVLSGKFMTDFEKYTLDQFPMRDQFRELKALFHYDVLGQRDNNGIYMTHGYAAKLEYPLNQKSLNHAVNRFQNVYDLFLKDTDAKVYFCPVPDKSYYLGEPNGYLALDYESMFSQLRQQLPWAQFIDITGQLGGELYYRTDTHWRQEYLFPAAGTIAQAMGVTAPRDEDFVKTALDRPFYGVYYGQAALPMKAETMYIMESPLLDSCTVDNLETGKTTPVYDMDRVSGRDMYDVFLSGATPLLTIRNPQGQPGKNLVVFRDSFGSSMIPLLLQDYETVTVADIRYITPQILQEHLQITDQDVLFLYSTLVLNSSSALK